MTNEGDDAQLLERFSQWLSETRAEIEQLDGDEGAAVHSEVAAEPAVGLVRLVEEFTALRHELKLQTKSSRGLEERSESLTESLRQAIDALRSVEPKEAQAAWNAGKSLATALAEMDEALQRGRAQTEKAIARLSGEAEDALQRRLDEFYSRQSWLGRWWHAGYHRRLSEALSENSGREERWALLEALQDGYRLVQKRLAQAMSAESIGRIDAVGMPVDPRQMVVVEVVETEDEPDGVVVDEVRCGYTWMGRVLLCAEVRAARNSPQR